MPRIHGATQVGWWDGHAAPTTGPTGTSTTWVGVQLQFTVAGRVYGAQMYDATGIAPAGWTTVAFGSADPEYPDEIGIRSICLAPSQSAKFHHLWFAKPIRVNTSDTYRVMAYYLGGGFFRTNNALTSAVTRNGVKFLGSYQSTSLQTSFGTVTLNTNANAVDVLFLPD